MVVIAVGKVTVVHLLTVFVNAPVLAIDVHNAALTGSLIEVQVRQAAQGLAIGIPHVGATGKGVVVVRRGFKNQALKLAPVGQVKQLGVHHIIVPHLVTGDVVKSLLRIGIGIVTVLVGIAFGLYPKRAVFVEKLNVHGFISDPCAIFQTGPTDAHHANGVLVVAKKVSVGIGKAWCHHTRWVDGDRPDHHGLKQPDRSNIWKARCRRAIAIQRIVHLHAWVCSEGQGHGIGMVAWCLAHFRHGDVTIVKEAGCPSIRGIGGGQCAHLPITAAIHVTGPTVVFLRGGNVCAIGIALYNTSRRIRKDHGLLLALVNAEIGVQESPSVQQTRLGFTAADDGQISIWGNDGSRWNFKLGGVVFVVGHVPAADVNGPGCLIEELHKVLIVARDIERIVGTRELVDHHLRRGNKRQQHRTNGEEERILVQRHNFTRYNDTT